MAGDNKFVETPSHAPIKQPSATKVQTGDYGLRGEILSPMETLAQSVSTIAPTSTPAATIPLVAALAGNGTWPESTIAAFGDDHEEVGAYLEALGSAAVVIRPDRYILGVARTPAELAAVAAKIPLRA